jgi:hypothetical protein
MSAYNQLIFVMVFVAYHGILFQTLHHSLIQSRQCGNDLNLNRENQSQPTSNESHGLLHWVPKPSSLEIQRESLGSLTENTPIFTLKEQLPPTTNASGLNLGSVDYRANSSNCFENSATSSQTWLRMCLVINDLTKSRLSENLESIKKEIGPHNSVGLTVVDAREDHTQCDLLNARRRYPEFQFLKLKRRIEIKCSDIRAVDTNSNHVNCLEAQRILHYSSALQQCKEQTMENGWVFLLDGSATFCYSGLNHVITLLMLLASGPIPWRSAHFSSFLPGLALAASSVPSFSDAIADDRFSPGPNPWASGMDFQYPGSLLRRARRGVANVLRTEELLGRRSGLKIQGLEETCDVAPLSQATEPIFTAFSI